jgi:prepilin-type N-terminal cleavage/methylation domain-containing protein
MSDTRVSERMTRGDEDGFTLIELLIVIVVLSILAAVTVLGLSDISGQSVTAACHADEKSVEVAQEAYRAQTGAYATTMASLESSTTPGGPYLRTPPGNTDKYVITTDGNGIVYVNGVNFDTATSDPCENLSTPPSTT